MSVSAQSLTHCNFKMTWDHRVQQFASVYTGVFAYQRYWKPDYGLNIFTDQRTFMELLCNIYSTFYRTQVLTDFLWLNAFAARGVGIDETFKIASRARVKEDGVGGIFCT